MSAVLCKRWIFWKPAGPSLRSMSSATPQSGTMERVKILSVPGKATLQQEAEWLGWPEEAGFPEKGWNYKEDCAEAWVCGAHSILEGECCLAREMKISNWEEI